MTSSDSFSLSPLVMPTVEPALTMTTMTTSDLESDIQEFWSTFPCPPPWRPHLLLEVNSTRLETRVGRTVQTFLAGKCHIQHVLNEHSLDSRFNYDDRINDPRSRSKDGHDPGSTLGDPTPSDHDWCDTGCKLSVGCAVVFVIMAAILAVLLCLNKGRRPHKMASARPSRQQLQLSTSTSDNVMETHGEDPLIYPPFRHRGLPPAPTNNCHHPYSMKWNCPNCSSSHPLIKTSPTEEGYSSRTYSAVYEIIDDDNDDVSQTQDPPLAQSVSTGEQTHLNNGFRNSWHNYPPCCLTPESTSSHFGQQRERDNVKFTKMVAETGFNGEDSHENMCPCTLVRYYELDQTRALSNELYPGSSMAIEQTTIPTSSPDTSAHDRETVCLPPPRNRFLAPQSCCYPGLVNTPLHSYVMSQAWHNAVPNASDLYRTKPTDDITSQPNTEPLTELKLHSSNLNCELNMNYPSQDCAHRDYSNLNQTGLHVPSQHSTSSWLPRYPPTNMAGTSSFLPESPEHRNSASTNSNSRLESCSPLAAVPSTIPSPTESTSAHRGSMLTPSVDYDIPRQGEQDASTIQAFGNKTTIDLNDQERSSLQKPVLALHSQYFANVTSI